MPVPVATSRTCLGDSTGPRPSLPLRTSLHIWYWRSARFSWVNLLRVLVGGEDMDASRRFCSGWRGCWLAVLLHGVGSLGWAYDIMRIKHK